MILFQITADSLSSTQDFTNGSLFFRIELILIIGIVIYQFYHFYKVYQNIISLRDIFNFRLKVKNGYLERSSLNKSESILDEIVFEDEDEDFSFDDPSDQNIIKISIIETTGNNKILSRIKFTINTYLLNNYGAAVNFSIIKDIIDREVDVKDEEISQSIPTPLYLGLAATMLGIIFGLLSMPNFGEAEFYKGIMALINGVKLAMTASLTGLLCTTILSSFFYKNAKKKIFREKNDQLSYLQAKLLPELIRAEDTGVSGLKASLDIFARQATKIVENVNIAANQTGMNIKAQLDVITKIENIDMMRISKTNLELFDRLEKNMTAFNRFSEFLSFMDQISTNLKEFAARTTNIDVIVDQIDSSLQESKQLSRFLTSHFEKIEVAGSAALKAVDLSDSYFKEAIEKLKEEIDNRIQRLNENADNNEIKLSEIYHDIIEKLGTITTEHLEAFQSAYSKSVPQFNQLNHLETLQPIKESLDKKTEFFLESNKGLRHAINELSLKITGKESTQINKKMRMRNFFKNSELILRIIAWIAIISYGIHTFLIYFEILY